MNSVLVKDISNVGVGTDRIGVAVAKAMDDAPDYQYVLEKKHNRVQPLSWFFGRFAAKLALRYGRILTTGENDAGIFAFAPTQSPSLFAVIKAGALMLPVHFGVLGAWRAFLLGIHLEKRRLSLVTEPHWYILAVGVEPGSQSLGKGGALLKQILQTADADNVPTYLEIFEEQLIALYEPMGFSVVHKDHLPGGLTLWCLKRPSFDMR